MNVRDNDRFGKRDDGRMWKNMEDFYQKLHKRHRKCVVAWKEFRVRTVLTTRVRWQS